MKLAFVAAAGSPHTIKWVNAMASKGHQVTLYSMPNHKDEYGEIAPNVRVEYLGLNEAQNGAKKNAAQLKAALSGGGYDAVVAIDMTNYGYMAAKAGAQNVLLVSTGIDIYQMALSGKKAVVVKAIKHARGVLATAPNVITKIQEVYKKEKAYYTVPFGVDMNLFQNKEVEKGSVPCFGSIKFLEFMNSVDLVLEAFGKYLKKTGKEAKLKVVGSGVLEADLKSKAQALGIADSVEFLGYVKNADLPDVINTMDLVVQMTKEECFGVSGVEAMACGVPMVASDTFGASEYVLNHVTGYLVKAGNTDACAEKMAEAVRNPQALEKMGALAREDVLEKYRLDNCATKFEAALREVAARVL